MPVWGPRGTAFAFPSRLVIPQDIHDVTRPAFDRPQPAVKPKLLVIELWGLGDLLIATPFLQTASQRYAVTLVAKPYAVDLQKRFWPGVKVVPFIAPWTAFKHKYRLLAWPWGGMFRLLRGLAAERFDFGLSARWDPRDHLLLLLARARIRLGFPRWGSRVALARPLGRPDPTAHIQEKEIRRHNIAVGDTLSLRTFSLLNHVSRQGPTVMIRRYPASRTVSVSIVTVLFKPDDA